MYLKTAVPFAEIPQFSERDKAYQAADQRLAPFFAHKVSIESFPEIARQRKANPVDRELLVKTLRARYKDLDQNELVMARIDLLSCEDTFTLVTAHQPSVLTGPLYFIYKICSILSLSKKLNDTYDDFRTVPVFILGGEDHDFDEIASLNLFGQKYTWKTDQTGSCGRMNLDGLERLLNEVKEKFGTGSFAEDLASTIDESYEAADSYGQFMFHLVYRLFRKHGLIILDMDQPEFKKKLLPFVLKDLHQNDSQQCVENDQSALKNVGFKSQAHARKVNVFWMDKARDRVIDNSDGTYEISGSQYTTEELSELFTNDPGSISPNVILRPVYQELILPNLAYIGGGGELAYWLERKSLFEKWSIPFPMLVRRDSVLILDKRTANFLESKGLDILDLFAREEQLFGKFAQLMSPVEINLQEERESIRKEFQRIAELAERVDPTLKKTVLSEESKAQKSLSYLESKMLKAEKTKNEAGINKLKKAKGRYFPGNDGLQERHDNFIQFYLRYGHEWIDSLIEHLDPMDLRFKILIES